MGPLIFFIKTIPVPFSAADWSVAFLSPRDWSSTRCQACQSPSHPWWHPPSRRTLALASGSTDTAVCPWAAGRTFSQMWTPCQQKLSSENEAYKLTLNTTVDFLPSVLLPVISGHDGVELCNVVHHGRLQGDLFHEHGWGGDVLDLSLQKHLIRLSRSIRKSNYWLLLTVEHSLKQFQAIFKVNWATQALTGWVLGPVRFVQNSTLDRFTFLQVSVDLVLHCTVRQVQGRPLSLCSSERRQPDLKFKLSEIWDDHLTVRLRLRQLTKMTQIMVYSCALTSFYVRSRLPLSLRFHRAICTVNFDVVPKFIRFMLYRVASCELVKLKSHSVMLSFNLKKMTWQECELNESYLWYRAIKMWIYPSLYSLSDRCVNRIWIRFSSLSGPWGTLLVRVLTSRFTVEAAQGPFLQAFISSSNLLF